MSLLFISTVMLLICPAFNSSSQAQLELNAPAAQEKPGSADSCSRAAGEQAAIIRAAEKGRFTLRRVEFIGNVSIADGVLRRRIVSRMAEGNLFSRRQLIASLKNLNRLRTIYPVSMKDVVAQVDTAERTLDLRICFREKPRPVRRSSTPGQ